MLIGKYNSLINVQGLVIHRKVLTVGEAKILLGGISAALAISSCPDIRNNVQGSSDWQVRDSFHCCGTHELGTGHFWGVTEAQE